MSHRRRRRRRSMTCAFAMFGNISSVLYFYCFEVLIAFDCYFFPICMNQNSKSIERDWVSFFKHSNEQFRSPHLSNSNYVDDRFGNSFT